MEENQKIADEQFHNLQYKYQAVLAQDKTEEKQYRGQKEKTLEATKASEPLAFPLPPIESSKKEFGPKDTSQGRPSGMPKLVTEDGEIDEEDDADDEGASDSS